MPERRDIFAIDNIYHIFNKYIDGKRLFAVANYAQLFLDTMYYYRSTKVHMSFSRFKSLDKSQQSQFYRELAFKKYFRVDILGYCLMPTHFHLILKQLQDGAIQSFMSDCINSFTRYLNTKMKRKGPLFLPRFKSRQIVSDEQFIHVSRYKHLNPYSSGIVTNIDELATYPWSSYVYFISDATSPLVNTEPILSMFDNNKSRYKSFVTNQADYQKSLELLKYAQKWKF